MIGHNNPPHVLALTEAQALQAKIAAIKIDSVESALVAAQLLDDATKGEKKADKDRADEKEPHLKAGRQVDDDWRAPIKAYAEAKSAIKTKSTAWLVAERQRKEAEAEAARIEAERAMEAAASVYDSDSDELDRAIAIAQADKAIEAAQEAEKPVVSQLVGGGRARGLKTVYSATVTDPSALVVALAANTEVQEVAIRVANAMARAMKDSFALAGCQLKKDQTL